MRSRTTARATQPLNLRELKQRALWLLSRREQCRADLQRKLLRVAPAESIVPLLDELEREGHLSDLRYAIAYVHGRSQRYGAAYLCAALKVKGVDASVIDTALQQTEVADAPNELARAQEIWRKRFATEPQDAQERARCMRFFLRRGFSSATVRQILEAHR